MKVPEEVNVLMGWMVIEPGFVPFPGITDFIVNPHPKKRNIFSYNVNSVCFMVALTVQVDGILNFKHNLVRIFLG